MDPMLGPFPSPNDEGAWARYLVLPIFGLWILAEYDRYIRHEPPEEG